LTFEIGHGHNSTNNSHNHKHSHDDDFIFLRNYFIEGTWMSLFLIVGSIILIVGLFFWFNRSSGK
nr:hypothetical protein [Saprospiraceae bacterium]